MKNQLQPALDTARQEGKLVFVSFTGYACTNCHWMKANMFTRPEIQAALGNFVLVELYTDGTDPDSAANQTLQESKFRTIAIPYYAILDPGGSVVASFPGLTRKPEDFMAFLQTSAGAPAAGSQAVSASAKPAGTTSASGLGALQALAATNLDGSPLDVSSLQGKVTVVNFWATWCVPCIREIPSFNKVHEELGAKGVKVVGVSMDEDGAPIVQKFLKDYPMQYAVAIGSETLNDSFQVEQLPTTVIFDHSGRVVKRFEGYTEHGALEEAIRAAL
jgi:thiol:disulfide interchange protein DsbD